MDKYNQSLYYVVQTEYALDQVGHLHLGKLQPLIPYGKTST